MASSPEALLEAYQAGTEELSKTLARLVGSAFDELTEWHDADIAAFVRQVTPLVGAVQRKMAALTDGYVAQMATLDGAAARPLGIPRDVVSSQGLRGVKADEVYTRVGHEIWNALSRGNSLESAVKQGRDRALGTARTDLQLAKTHAMAYVAEQSDRVTGFARVPDGAACDLCIISAQQVYKAGDLMPIHERCGCDVEPLFGSDERNASSTPDRPDDPVNVGVEDHGELGPVLVDDGHTFTGEDDF